MLFFSHLNANNFEDIITESAGSKAFLLSGRSTRWAPACWIWNITKSCWRNKVVFSLVWRLCACVHVCLCVRECVSHRHNTFRNQNYVQMPGNEVVVANVKQRAHCDLNSLFFKEGRGLWLKQPLRLWTAKHYLVMLQSVIDYSKKFCNYITVRLLINPCNNPLLRQFGARFAFLQGLDGQLMLIIFCVCVYRTDCCQTC